MHVVTRGRHGILITAIDTLDECHQGTAVSDRRFRIRCTDLPQGQVTRSRPVFVTGQGQSVRRQPDACPHEMQRLSGYSVRLPVALREARTRGAVIACEQFAGIPALPDQQVACIGDQSFQ